MTYKCVDDAKVGIALPGLVSDDGEYAAGYAKVRSEPELKDVFYISLGNNVGGSVLINNKIYAGAALMYIDNLIINIKTPIKNATILLCWRYYFIRRFL